MLKNLYKKYTQKSRIFLYPLLNIKRGSSVVPIQTYVSVEGLHKPDDMKLICLYDVRTDLEFRMFEKSRLVGNPRFENYIEIEDEKCLYIFDFSTDVHLWDCFLKGKFSKINSDTKIAILNFFSNNPSNRDLINSYLNPENYFKTYAEYLNVPVKELRDVGELCSIPDINEETLKVSVKQNQFLSIFEL